METSLLHRLFNGRKKHARMGLIRNVIIQHILEVASHEVTRENGVTSHVVRFLNGGVFRYRYRDDGIVEELSGGSWITITVTPEKMIVVHADHTRGHERLVTLVPCAPCAPVCGGPGPRKASPSFQFSPEGDLDITFPEPLEAISIANLAEIVSHEITHEAGATLHLIGFQNGGTFRLLWTDEGEIKAFSGHRVAAQLVEDHQLVLWDMPTGAVDGPVLKLAP